MNWSEHEWRAALDRLAPSYELASWLDVSIHRVRSWRPRRTWRCTARRPPWPVLRLLDVLATLEQHSPLLYTALRPPPVPRPPPRKPPAAADLSYDFGACLASLQSRRGWTDREMAWRLGTARSSIAGWRDRTHQPKGPTRRLLAVLMVIEALHPAVLDLLGSDVPGWLISTT